MSLDETNNSSKDLEAPNVRLSNSRAMEGAMEQDLSPPPTSDLFTPQQDFGVDFEHIEKAEPWVPEGRVGETEEPQEPDYGDLSVLEDLQKEVPLPPTEEEIVVMQEERRSFVFRAGLVILGAAILGASLLSLG